MPRPGLEEAWAPWRVSTAGLRRGPELKMGRASSVRKLLSQRADGLSLIRKAQASVCPAESLMAPASGPGHLHRAANKGAGFSSSLCFLVTDGHSRTSAAYRRAAGTGPLTPVPPSKRTLGQSLTPLPPTRAQVTLSFLCCSLVPVPGTKEGSPLLLKIHFKLSSPSSPEK